MSFGATTPGGDGAGEEDAATGAEGCAGIDEGLGGAGACAHETRETSAAARSTPPTPRVPNRGPMRKWILRLHYDGIKRLAYERVKLSGSSDS